MNIITRLHLFFTNLESKRFYRYVLIFIIGILLLSAAGIFQYYRSIKSFRKEIQKVNALRAKAKDILTRTQIVDQQRAEVNALLMEEPDFKIGGYFKKLLTDLNITQKEKMETTQTVEREDAYIEHTLTAQFVDMNMKDVTLLLEKIESNPRISTRQLEIKKSEKTPGTIEVTLEIATLLPKATTA